MSGSFGSGAAMPYSWMLTGCQSWKVISPSVGAALRRTRSRSPADHRRRDTGNSLSVETWYIAAVGWLYQLLHDSPRLPETTPPWSATTRMMFGSLGLIHDLLIVVATRCAAHGGPREAAVLGAPEHRGGAVDDVLVLRIDGDRGQVAAADAHQGARVLRARCAIRRRLGEHELPVLACVARLVEADDARGGGASWPLAWCRRRRRRARADCSARWRCWPG